MAVSGFEGFEKRLELHFFGDDNDPTVTTMGLRLLDFESLENVLRVVQCTVVSAVGNHFFDAYVLSESSLFVYPTKIIIKTCGTTQLLKSIRPLIHLAKNLGLTICGCRYTRALICDFVFDPCGYSMNGVDGDRYSTIHVTPEDGFSYASFEYVGSVYDDQDDIVETLKKAVQVFKPATVSVSTTSHRRE
ncbi:hypothetical protein Gotri_014137, partial [Gossypium trilobum]|nr:hypothetical protein [Gossypium trilobum]